MRRYWIGVASFDHVKIGMIGSFAQLCHGKEAPLKRMKENDIIIYYSPVKTLGGKEKCQCFSAIGKMMDNSVYPFKMSENFIPFRRNVEFLQNTTPVSIHDLLYELDFIKDVVHYGEKFRYGHFEISKKDCMTIWHKMKP